MPLKKIPLVQYLFGRLRQLGCHSIHGVPGDFFLRALDHTRPAGLNWIGNSNELCAGYAADGYARAGHHIAARQRSGGPRVGALFTTFGVGELSAINAVAGSYAESVPVVHLVGTPPRKAWDSRSAARPIHHTLANGRLDAFSKMARHVSCVQVKLHQYQDPEVALEAYDELLEQCVIQSKPVYASVPSDMLEIDVPAKLLDRPLTLTSPAEDVKKEAQVSARIAEKFRAAQRPLLIVDGLCYPFDFLTEANELAKLMPTAAFTAGKGVIDETSSTWLGGLSGPIDYQPDLVIMLGPLLSDTNTAAWTAVPDAEAVVKINLDTVDFDDEEHYVGGKAVVQRVLSQLRDELSVSSKTVEDLKRSFHNVREGMPGENRTSSISQDNFWTAMSSFLKPHDTVLLANGTPLLGGRELNLPSPTQVVASSIWCSIGQMLPAAQGIALAKRDHNIPGRTVLFEGDGSFQVTCQALSDIIRYKLDVTIFILNNGGYTYERWLNGMEAEYNDMPNWRYSQAPRFFGAAGQATDYPIMSIRVEKWSALKDALAAIKRRGGKGLQLVEVAMDAEDVPESSIAGLRRGAAALRPSP